MLLQCHDFDLICVHLIKADEHLKALRCESMARAIKGMYACAKNISLSLSTNRIVSTSVVNSLSRLAMNLWARVRSPVGAVVV